jgi:hypothetical protein
LTSSHLQKPNLPPLPQTCHRLQGLLANQDCILAQPVLAQAQGLECEASDSEVQMCWVFSLLGGRAQEPYCGSERCSGKVQAVS